MCRAPVCYHWLGTMRSGGGLCTQGPSANLLHRECLFCFVFRVGVFCLLTQLKTLKTVPVQWVYKILEIGYSALLSRMQPDVRLPRDREVCYVSH